VGDEWYLIGYCHLRAAVRTFRLSRIHSHVRYATHSGHDFSVPPDFNLADYRDRPAWQLGDAADIATITVGPEMAWWVEAHFSHCGTIRPSDAEAGSEASGITFMTPYASARALVGWVLELGPAAEITAPPELRQLAAKQLRLLAERLDDPALPTAPASAMLQTSADVSVAAGSVGRDSAGGDRAGGRQRRPADDWHVEVDRFTRLTALSSYLLKHCSSADEAALPVGQVCAALGLSTAQLKADVRLLNLVNFGGDGSLLWAEFKGKHLLVTCDMAGSTLAQPARLSPLQADTLLLAIELVGGQLPSASGAALVSAAQKLRRARHGAAPAVTASELLFPQESILAAVNRAIKEQYLLDIEYWSEGISETTRRTIEPYLMVRSRGEWYYVSFCHKSQGVRVFRVATTKQAIVLAQHFTPRPDLELDLYRREGIPSSARYAAKTAIVWYSSAVARWIGERRPTTRLDGGSCLAEQPYVDEAWLTHHLLRFAGEAAPLAPSAAASALRAAVATLLARYARG
ncbi:MAG: WYL domain-containing protein, partial [Thermoleophilia bacterium]